MSQFGGGQPHAKQTAKLRAELLASISPDDSRDVVRKLVELAKSGDMVEIREVLKRTIGHELLLLDATISHDETEATVTYTANWQGNLSRLHGTRQSV